MTDAGYVIAGWLVTAIAIAAYWLWILQRTRRAQRSLPRTEDRE